MSESEQQGSGRRSGRSRGRRGGRFESVYLNRGQQGLMGLLRRDPKLRWALGVLFVLVVTLLLLLPKMWLVTPDDFDQELRISGLDMMQSASLRKSALKKEAEGFGKEAGQAWMSALGNHPVDLRNLRGFMDWLGDEADIEKRWLGQAMSRGSLLLRLTGTNVNDAALVGRVMSRYEMHDWVLQNLGGDGVEMSLEVVRLLARAYFETGRMRELGDFWERHGNFLGKDPEVDLYRAAWQAGWGPAGDAAAGRSALEAARPHRELGIIAMRLELGVIAARMEVDAFEKLLEQLVDRRGDRVRDHVRFWLLLMAAGRGDQAKMLASAHVRPPATEGEAELLGVALHRLGMVDEAADLIRKQLDVFGHSVRLWGLGGRLLTQLERWEDLRLFGSRMRRAPQLRGLLEGYGFFLEGVAEHGRGILPRAAEHFARAVEAGITQPLLALDAAIQMQRMGFPHQATDLMRSIEDQFASRTEFWKSMAHAAFDARQTTMVLLATQRAYELAPMDLNHANNYAAALLLNRTNASEAIRLTLDLINRIPNSKITRVNHALALNQNARYAEALSVLQSIPASALEPEERALWYLGLFEAEMHSGRLEEAKLAADQVELRFLFPNQLEWLNAERVRLWGAPEEGEEGAEGGAGEVPADSEEASSGAVSP